MSVVCPKCDKINLCACPSCNNSGKSGVIIELRDEDLYQCSYCDSRFHPCEALDYEWDKMIESFAKKATPEICYEWLSGFKLDGEKVMRRDILDSLQIGEFGIEKAIEAHFGVSMRNITKEKIDNIKVQLIRDKKINQIL